MPKEIFATAMFAYATDLLSRMAAVLNKDDEAKQYAALLVEIKAAFNKAYVSEDGRMQGNTQAVMRWRCISICCRKASARWQSNI